MIGQVCVRCAEPFYTEIPLSPARCRLCRQADEALIDEDVARLRSEVFPDRPSSASERRPGARLQTLATSARTMLARVVSPAKRVARAGRWQPGLHESSLEGVLLARLARLAAIRALGTPAPSERRPVDHALCSTYEDLVELGLRSEARQILRAAQKQVSRGPSPGPRVAGRT